MLSTQLHYILTIVFTSSLCQASTIPNNDASSRVISKNLSDRDHIVDGLHNYEYDHEAFLGKDMEEQFLRLKPEESKRRLGVIADRIDSDNNGKVTEEELTLWVRNVEHQHIMNDSKRIWKDYNEDLTHKITWNEYIHATFGEFREEDWPSKEEFESAKIQRDRDQRRFKLADQDYDGALSFDEFVNFLHPEDVEHMRTAVVRETIEDLDENNDGKISQQEYIADQWTEMGKEQEPEWVKNERVAFTKWRDVNKDGYLDEKEVGQWILPDDYDSAIAESKHLIHEADMNKDGVLTRREILENHGVFVGSQVTNYGRAMGSSRDEF